MKFVHAKIFWKGVYMLVSAVTLNQAHTFSKLQNSQISSKGYDTDYIYENNTPSANGYADFPDSKLFYYINQWKHFCYHQIEKGNLDVIA